MHPRSLNIAVLLTLLSTILLASAKHSYKRAWYSRSGSTHHHSLPRGTSSNITSNSTTAAKPKHIYATATVAPSNASTPTNSTNGCGQTPGWTPDETGHVNVTMGDRSFLVHLPTAYKPHLAHPLVLSFHGFKGNDVQQEEITGFSAPGLMIGGKGLIAVYPNGQWGPGKHGDQTIRAWQGAPYAAPGVDDIHFTQDIVRAVKENLCVDPKRVYASGKSNGGGFTNLLACTPATANLFAAFAPVSAALYPHALYPNADPSQCAPGRVVPIINFHGLNDTIIPFKGQKGDHKGSTAYATPDIDIWRQGWADRNAMTCAGTPSTSSNSPSTNTTAHASMSKDGSMATPGSSNMAKLAMSVSHPHKDTTLTTLAILGAKCALASASAHDSTPLAPSSPSAGSNSTGDTANARIQQSAAAAKAHAIMEEEREKEHAIMEKEREKEQAERMERLQKHHAVVHGFSVLDLGHTWPNTAGLDGGRASFNATTANIIPFFETQSL